MRAETLLSLLCGFVIGFGLMKLAIYLLTDDDDREDRDRW